MRLLSCRRLLVLAVVLSAVVRVASGQMMPGAPAEKPDEPEPKKLYATDAQVKEFDELVKALGVSPEAVAKRLAHFGAAEPHGVTREDMETILARLRNVRDQRAAAAAQEKTPEKQNA